MIFEKTAESYDQQPAEASLPAGVKNGSVPDHVNDSATRASEANINKTNDQDSTDNNKQLKTEQRQATSSFQVLVESSRLTDGRLSQGSHTHWRFP